MTSKQFACSLLFTFLCCSLLAVAQAPPVDNDSAFVKGKGTTGTIALWTATKKIGNSTITQDGGGNQNFAAGINAVGVISGSSDVNAAGNVNASTGGVFGNAFLDTAGNTFSGEGFFFNPSPGAGIFNWTTDNGGSSYPVGGQTLSTAGTSFEFAFFDSNGSPVFYGDSLGDTIAIGSKSAAVPLKNGHMVKMFAQESPKNWFEDFGSAKLVGGVATVKLDSNFAQTINTRLDYHVFLTPNGDCHGLYVAQKTHNSFEVRELGGGQSNVSFDYRIAGLRVGYEKVRMPPAQMPKVQKRPTPPRH